MFSAGGSRALEQLHRASVNFVLCHRIRTHRRFIHHGCAIGIVVPQRIASDLKPRHLERMATRVIDFDELPGAFDIYMHGGITGRTIVRIARG